MNTGIVGEAGFFHLGCLWSEGGFGRFNYGYASLDGYEEGEVWEQFSIGDILLLFYWGSKIFEATCPVHLGLDLLLTTATAENLAVFLWVFYV